MKKKLIEVALPLDAINAASVKEKSLCFGHPSTLHKWWARRPLVACRAILFAQLVDDPSAHPDRFPTEIDQDEERQRLFGIIEDLVKWDNSASEQVLASAHREILGSCDGNPPPILDPFAGGGSIPLEVQRLGLKAYASDLNPVAALINKALIEIPAQLANQSPVHPEADVRTRWEGIEGLIEDVRLYGQWTRDEAERRIGYLYPKAILPEGTSATVIAWLWARTVTCPNPACAAKMPLVRSFWLAKKRARRVYAQPLVVGRDIQFQIRTDSGGPELEGTIGRRGAVCLRCREPVELDHIRKEARADRMDSQLMAIAAEGNRRRDYIAPQRDHIEASLTAPKRTMPRGTIPKGHRNFQTPNYGMEDWSDLYTNRQATLLGEIADLLHEVRDRIESDSGQSNMSVNDRKSYARAVVTYLALLTDKQADLSNSLVRWEPNAECPQQLFARQAIPMTWDYAEPNPFSQSSGSWQSLLNNLLRAMRNPSFDFKRLHSGSSMQQDARTIARRAVICTDPPYYDNVCYAELSDFFYVLLRRSLRDYFPELFATVLAPKGGELIAVPHRNRSITENPIDYFERGFVEVFSNALSVSTDGFPLTFFYAFKQSEDSMEGRASTGWATMLEGLLSSGWMVTATWPMRTEKRSRMIGLGTNALASSIVLACRPRPDNAATTDRQDLLQTLRSEMPVPIRELQKAAIAPVDLRQAAIGPGMAVFSRYARVVEADGTPMRVHTALGLINQVLEAVLGEAEAALDPETRWAISWFAQHFEDEGPYGIAEQLAVSMNVAVDSLVRSGILQSGGGTVRLLSRDELPADWQPPADARTPIWKATQHLVRRIPDGEAVAGALLAQLGPDGQACQALAYRLYSICETARPNLAGPYNDLAASWSEIHRHSTQAPPMPPTSEPQLFEN